MVRRLREALALVSVLALLLVNPEKTEAYSVTSHQAIIDVVWESSIKPAIRKRFPKARKKRSIVGKPMRMAERLSRIWATTLWQSVLQRPDTLHSKRDFILAMLRDSRDVYEYSFALAPWRTTRQTTMDIAWESTGRCRSCTRNSKEVCDSVSYEDDKLAHIKTEFGFDVLEVAKERFAPESYHDYIGFEVALECWSKRSRRLTHWT